MTTPREYADRRVILAGEYSRMSEELAQILDFKALSWNTMRDMVKSDKAADRRWEQTDNGRKETKLRLGMKANLQEQSAISSKLRSLENEAKNIW